MKNHLSPIIFNGKQVDVQSVQTKCQNNRHTDPKIKSQAGNRDITHGLMLQK